MGNEASEGTGFTALVAKLAILLIRLATYPVLAAVMGYLLGTVVFGIADVFLDLWPAQTYAENLGNLVGTIYGGVLGLIIALLPKKTRYPLCLP